MARRTGPRNKLARREGEDLGLKTPGSSAHASLQKRINIPPGEHGPKRYKPRLSDYAIRLREKQKAKRIYGVLEKQFKGYVGKSVAQKGNTLQVLIEQLERRLDNVVYRLGFAPTRPAARQLVNHRHVFVNGKVVDIASYKVKTEEEITISEKAKNIPAVEKILQESNLNIPQWLTKKKFSGKIETLPKREHVKEPVDWQLIIEFYTR